MLQIIGEIDDLTEVYTAISDATEDVEILINSPGGSAFEAIQLVNLIDKCGKKVKAKVEVQAMSAAAVIALGCPEVELDSKAIVMLHNCWSVAIGNAKELEQQAEAMKAVDNALQEIVTTHCSEENADYIRSKMDDGELWLTGKQAAELFDNVTLCEKQEKQTFAAAGELAGLVEKMQALETELAELKAEAVAPIEAEAKEEVEEAPAEIVDAVEEEPVKEEEEEQEAPAEPEQKLDYVVTDELKALLALELE